MYNARAKKELSLISLVDKVGKITKITKCVVHEVANSVVA